MELAFSWYLVIGFLFVLVGLTSSFFARLPVTTSILYFLIGILVGNQGLQIIRYDLSRDHDFFEKLTELVVLVSLFVAGLKLRLPLKAAHWKPTLRLAFVSMVVTVGLIAAFSYFILGLSVGAGVLLGAILAPTDPVLASEVQVRDPEDRDQLRFSLTGEAGLNDGTAFPFVMLGLGLLGLHEIGDWGLKWMLIDVLWAVPMGLVCGWVMGLLVSKLVLFLRRKSEETVFLDDFLALGLIALSYGIAHVIHAYGFLSVFAAGLAMRKIEGDKSLRSSISETVPITKAVRSFTEQMERIGEVFSVLILGAMLNLNVNWRADFFLIPVLLFLIRPIAVYFGLFGLPQAPFQRPIMAWFGIRGIGSIYYMTYAFGKGLPIELANRIEAIVYFSVVSSIFIHGLSGLPLMSFYQKNTDLFKDKEGKRKFKKMLQPSRKELS